MNVWICNRAVKQLVAIAFNQLGINRLYINIFEYNVASMRVLEIIGFEKEAIIKLSVIKEGRIFNEYIYSIMNI
ncbi:GNAT family N-acetyltransferase [Bacteroides faecium]|uniref:GNAT family N-acetyltransferase n=1 Tax=Bacteroides faecium TaxID=2715212 RepID=A0A6H0KVN1_9BACE|nr:GNAT family N-acetyltransferase [Bacteroides faecium]